MVYRSTFKSITLISGLLEEGYDEDELPHYFIEGGNIPEALSQMIEDYNISFLSGEYGQKGAANPDQYDCLIIETESEIYNIGFYNRGFALVFSDNKNIKKIHEVMCQVVDVFLDQLTSGYSEPVKKLFEIGPGYINKEWLKVEDYGLTNVHIPELLELACNADLQIFPTEPSISWAPIHAWRALSQLDAVDCTYSLLNLLEKFDDTYDIAYEEIPRVIAKFSQPDFKSLQKILADPSKDLWTRVAVTSTLRSFVAEDTRHNSDITELLESELIKYRENDVTLNSLIIGVLIDIKALGSLPLITKVHNDGYFDIQMSGDLEEIEISMGVREKRSTPKPKRWIGFSPIDEQELPGKLGRNDLCHCGSGKKYKKCCLKEDQMMIN